MYQVEFIKFKHYYNSSGLMDRVKDPIRLFWEVLRYFLTEFKQEMW